MNTPESNKSSAEVIAKVKCQECGFLAWRNNHTRELAEVELSYRQSGAFECSNVQRLFEPNPICFCLAFDIRNEVSSKTSVLDVISRERNCHGFVSWQHGMTPKEHLEMNILAEQRRWQELESERNRLHEKQMSDLAKAAEDDREKKRSDAESQRHAEVLSSNKRTFLWSLAVSSVVAIVGSIISGPVIEWLRSSFTGR